MTRGILNDRAPCRAVSQSRPDVRRDEGAARGRRPARVFAPVDVVIALAVLLAAVPVMADPREPTKNDLNELDARQAVRIGNERLTGGRPAMALEAYRHAGRLEPGAREIAFVEGLAHYDLKEFDDAREAFRRAAVPVDDDLADDALYSLGASDHLEALENLDGDPRLGLSLLESAMKRYHDVLARRPDHKAARDANFKAASIWRQLKEQLEQQQQRRQQDENQDHNEEESEEEQQSGPQDQEGQQQEQREQQQTDADQPREEQEQQQQSAAQKQEQVSREQAERRLREMMQAIRDRKKSRRQHVQEVPIAPVDKDW